MQATKAAAAGVAGILARSGGKPVSKAVNESKTAPRGQQTASSGGSKTPEGAIATTLGALLEARVKKDGRATTNGEWSADEHPLVENAPPPAPRVVNASFAAGMIKHMHKRRAE